VQAVTPQPVNPVTEAGFGRGFRRLSAIFRHLFSLGPDTRHRAGAIGREDPWPYAVDMVKAIHARQPEHDAMTTQTMPLTATAPRYELRFESLFDSGRGLSFPCDAGGSVALDMLSERARNNYIYARAVVGREFATPCVYRRDLH
jgi:hypothetical protein